MSISAVMTAHREGALAGISLRSLLDAAAAAERAGIAVEVLVVLDSASDATREAVGEVVNRGHRMLEVSFKDQGMVRNHAVEHSSGEYVAFLDGDDLWSENWLVESYQFCLAEGPRTIAHPQLDWFFDTNNNLFFHADQADPAFNPHFLRAGNYWDALCMAPRAAYVEHPYSARDISRGFAYEDWHWNLETYAAGYIHRVVPETIHFKRRRPGSQTLIATGNASLTRGSRVLDYRWAPDTDL